ncbi:MAG: hypothetical protein GC136_09765 [Alphaproteobacteria bacterium]|nr:hypothetical protein [Alphaproteobacteria bacterium]
MTSESKMTDEIDALGAKIDALKPKPQKADKSGFYESVGIRAGTELVVGPLVGGFLGFGLDKWLDISPIGLIAGVFLGVTTAFFNIYKLTIYGDTKPVAKHLKTANNSASNTPVKPQDSE